MIAKVFGEGTPLILVHGFAIDHRLLLPLEEAFEAMPWKRIYLDLPWAKGGHFNNEQTPADVADSVLAEVRSIVGDGEFAILGNSFGGMVARHIGHELQEQCLGLATLAGAFVMDRSKRTVPSHTVVQLDPALAELAPEATEGYQELAVMQTPETLALYRDFALPGMLESDQEILERIDAAYTTAYYPEDTADKAFPAPAVHIFGAQDSATGYEDGLAYREHYPRGSFAVLDSAGHNVHFDQRELVNSLLRNWLSRAEAYAKI